MRKRLFVIYCFLISSIYSFAATIEFTGETINNFGKKMEHLAVDNDKLTAREALYSNEFTKIDENVINLGVSDKTHWIRFGVLNKSDEQIVLNFPFPIIDEFDLFIYSEAGTLLESLNTGLKRPFSNRIYDHPDFSFPLPLGFHKVSIVLRLKNGSQLILPSSISNESSLNSKLYKKDMLMGVFMGIFLVMFLYNLFVYFSTRDINYGYYLFYLLTIAFAQFTLNGYSYKFLTPSSPFLSELSIYIAGILSGLSVMFFVVQFLHLKQRKPLIYKMLIGYGFVYLLAFIFVLIDWKQLSYNTINFTASTGSIIVLISSVSVAKSGYRPAKFFTIAWSIFLLSIVLFVLKDINILPYNNLTVYSMPFGAAFEVVLLALALADKINILENENKEAKERELSILKENEKLITEQNIELEKRVEERTSDLQAALMNLKNAQSQLVSQEKMASLGQLTAGIAHEINNPINFVSSSVSPLRRDIEDLKEVIKTYDDIIEKEKLIEINEKINNLKSSIEFDYVIDEINQLLSGIQEGADRTAEIVKGLKNFSRLDEIASKVADIHEGIKSTLIILKSGTKKAVDIQTKFDENIKPIECYPGKLNQVFSNLVINAIQAITSENLQIKDPKIVIETKDKGTKIKISIKDNGPGIHKDIQEKIFEPFFTTKEVGEGTGLGLSIVFSIIESHNGTIEVKSIENQGTEFIIEIPKVLHKI